MQLTVALRRTDSIIVPTKSKSHTSTSSAAPASSPVSNPAPKTTQVKPLTPKPTGSAESVVQDGVGSSSAAIHDQAPQETQEKTTRASGNVWPLPPSDSDSPDTTNALSILKTAQASAEAVQIAASIIAGAAKYQSQPSGGGGAHQTEDSDDPMNDHTADDPVKPTQTSLFWTQESEAFTAVLSNNSARLQGAGTVTTIANGNEAVFGGQNIWVSPEGDRIEIDGTVLSAAKEPIEDAARIEGTNKQDIVAFEASGQTFTAITHDGSVVLQAAGTTATIAYGDEATFAGNTMSLPSSGRSDINVNGDWVTRQALNRANNAMIPSSTV